MTAVTGPARTAAEVLSPLVGGGLIGLRVALGAAIMLALLVAVLVKTGQRAALRGFWLGAAAATVGAVGVHLLVRPGAANVTAVAAGGVAALIAVAFLTAVVLGGRAATPLPAALTAPAAFWLGAATAAAPGIPAALLLGGYAGAGWPVAGVGLGVLVAAAVGYTGYAVAVRIASRRFGPAAGLALIAVAAGLLSQAVGTLQQVGWLPGYHSWAFDTGWWSGWWSGPGSIVRHVLHVMPTPTVAQFAAWSAYLVVMLAVVLRPAAPRRRPPASPPATPAR